MNAAKANYKNRRILQPGRAGECSPISRRESQPSGFYSQTSGTTTHYNEFTRFTEFKLLSRTVPKIFSSPTKVGCSTAGKGVRGAAGRQ